MSSSDAQAGPSLRNGTVLLAACIALCAYFVTLHALLVERRMPWLVLALVLVPWLVAIAALTARRWRSSSTTARISIVASVIIVLGIAVLAIATVRDLGAVLVSNTDLVVYLENAAFFAWLSALFAASLSSPHEPLVTRMARKVRGGDMPPEVVRYTRRVTIAWALFFAIAIAISTLLFFAGSREVWSLFINLLIWPLVAVGFVVEYGVRVSVLRNVRHVSLMAGVQAFRGRHDRTMSP